MSETTAEYQVKDEYKYKGRELDRLIAEELILELFAGEEDVRTGKIERDVLQAHIDRGGLEYTRSTSPIMDALLSLKEEELTTNKKRGYWTVKPEETTKGGETDIGETIEQYISDSFNRLHPIIKEASEKVADGTPGSQSLPNYIELERLALELARYALDYYEITCKNKE
jgi:hypothetical protein